MRSKQCCLAITLSLLVSNKSRLPRQQQLSWCSHQQQLLQW
jgi:hypothetical protein